MSLTETEKLQCPYCWQTIEILVDISMVGESYVEDCFVCCRPIELNLTELPSGGFELTGKSENDI